MKEKVDIIGLIITWLVLLINKCIKKGGQAVTESLGIYKACILKEVE